MSKDMAARVVWAQESLREQEQKQRQIVAPPAEQGYSLLKTRHLVNTIPLLAYVRLPSGINEFTRHGFALAHMLELYGMDCDT